jgi:hypothetical protein
MELWRFTQAAVNQRVIVAVSVARVVVAQGRSRC